MLGQTANTRAVCRAGREATATGLLWLAGVLVAFFVFCLFRHVATLFEGSIWPKPSFQRGFRVVGPAGLWLAWVPDRAGAPETAGPALMPAITEG